MLSLRDKCLSHEFKRPQKINIYITFYSLKFPYSYNIQEDLALQNIRYHLLSKKVNPSTASEQCDFWEQTEQLITTPTQTQI